MNLRVTGGCLCGAIRYEYDGEVGPAGYCHCADCRRISGSAFGVSVRVKAAGFRIVSGVPKGFTKTGDSGPSVSPPTASSSDLHGVAASSAASSATSAAATRLNPLRGICR